MGTEFSLPETAEVILLGRTLSRFGCPENVTVERMFDRYNSVSFDQGEALMVKTGKIVSASDQLNNLIGREATVLYRSYSIEDHLCVVVVWWGEPHPHPVSPYEAAQLQRFFAS